MSQLDNITTPNELLEILQKNIENKTVVIENLRYAIYLRKSTDDPEKQVRSIEDQLSECLKVANDNKVIVLKEDIIEEKESAKEASIRPKFRKLLDRIIAGELDGIISWHPNRLSRNMRESGEIIDLLDKHIIRDLKFASHTFINDASGKMLLGIVFVMAKQYSDQLSIDVKRGNTASIEAGYYINKSKHGYQKDNLQRLQPDGNNFTLMKEAFQMRLRGDTLKSIAHFLNSSGYTRKNSMKGKVVSTKFSEQTLNKIFKDPVYTGILKYGDNVVNLIALHEFMPIITVPEFLSINKYDNYDQAFKGKRSRKNPVDKVADFMDGKVFCASCNVLTQANINKGKTKHYYNFKCTTPTCERYGKSTRGKIIEQFAYEFLAKKPFTSQKAYSSYKQEIVRLQTQGLSDLNSQINSAKRKLGMDSEDMAKTKLNIAKEDDPAVLTIRKEEFVRLEQEIFKTQTLIAELLSRKENVSKAPLSFKEFTEVMNSLPDRLKKVQSTTELNSIVSKIFSNFTVSSKEVCKYKLNQPFDGLEETKISHGAG